MRYSEGNEFVVTPFVGVWIETVKPLPSPLREHVTPFVGVWIETLLRDNGRYLVSVTPFVGVWIETFRCAL